MSTAVARADYDRDKIELIKQTVAKGATDLELQLFFHACQRTGLDPLMKQIYAIKRWSSQDRREVMSFQCGIDGYRLIADRTGQYAGSSDAIYDGEADGQPPDMAQVTVLKIVNGEKCAFTASARWDEYCQKTKDGEPTAMWKKMPYLMLAKCAEALALRKAFPAELSGVYTHEEMMQADVETVPSIEQKKQAARTKMAELVAHPVAETDTVANDEVTAELDHAEPSPAPSTYILKIGRQKGQPITAQTDDNLGWSYGYYAAKLKDQPDSKYRDEWELALAEIEQEQKRRG